MLICLEIILSLAQIFTVALSDVGNRIRVVDPAGNVIYTDYDHANRKTTQFFAAPPETERGNLTENDVAESTEYYPDNAVKKIISYDYLDAPAGHAVLAQTQFEYDGQGRIKKVTEDIDGSSFAITEYDYNDEDFAVDYGQDYKDYDVRIADAEDKITWWDYDCSGNLTEIKYPSGLKQQMSYYGNGLLKQEDVYVKQGEQWNQQWISYAYDGFGRREKTVYPDDGYVEFFYDGFGRRTAVEDHRQTPDNIGGDGIITYDFDPLGRVIQVTDQDDYDIGYNWRADGQRESVVVNDPSDVEIYNVEYAYDSAGRLDEVYDNDTLIASFGYDANGNRKTITYDGTTNDVEIEYFYNLDNLLNRFKTSNGPTFNFGGANPATDPAEIDGLGRLTDGTETLTKTNGSTINHVLDYTYDRMSQLTAATISNIGGSSWSASYTYHKDGNLDERTVQTTEDFSYNGNLLTSIDSSSLNWDLNGNLSNSIISTEMIWNWDNKLRSAAAGEKSIALKYDPEGNRIYKESSDGSTTIKRKFIVGVIGALSVILAEINPANSQLVKSYIYANDQVIAQHDGDYSADKYFYLHDRLGSVRQIIDDNADVKNSYTYNPFGEDFPAETEETITNPFKFTGQYYDAEINQYYLRARQYDPHLSRFTSIDPVNGNFNEPLTLHQYLYCLNDPINRYDLTGQFSLAGLKISTAIRYGFMAWRAYDAYSRAKSYAEMVAEGAAWRSVFTNVAIDAAWEIGGGGAGKLFGAAVKGAGKLVGKILSKSGKEVVEHMHHVIPKYLGGLDDGFKFPLEASLHRKLHTRLMRNLEKSFKHLEKKYKRDIWHFRKEHEWQNILENPAHRQEIYMILGDTYSDFDKEFGTNVLSEFVDELAKISK